MKVYPVLIYPNGSSNPGRMIGIFSDSDKAEDALETVFADFPFKAYPDAAATVCEIELDTQKLTDIGVHFPDDVRFSLAPGSDGRTEG
jgi:hypothetical protein